MAEKMKKRIVVSIIIFILLIIFLSGGIFLFKKNTHKVSKEPESGTKTIDIKKEEKKAKTNGIKSVTTLRKQQLIDMILEVAQKKEAAQENQKETNGEE